MTFDASTETKPTESVASMIGRKPSRSRARKPAPKKRTVNYCGHNSPATLAKQAEITRWIAVADEGFTVSEIAAILGISRQLCLYHIKKMAAQKQLVMIVEPCEANGGLQYRVWDHTQFMINYVPSTGVAA